MFLSYCRCSLTQHTTTSHGPKHDITCPGRCWPSGGSPHALSPGQVSYTGKDLPEQRENRRQDGTHHRRGHNYRNRYSQVYEHATEFVFEIKLNSIFGAKSNPRLIAQQLLIVGIGTCDLV